MGSIPSVTVSFPAALRVHVGVSSVVVYGETVREVIEALEREYAGVRFMLCYETGEQRKYVNIFVNRENIRYLQGLETPVSEGAQIHIMPSVAGG